MEYYLAIAAADIMSSTANRINTHNPDMKCLRIELEAAINSLNQIRQSIQKQPRDITPTQNVYEIK